MNLSTQAKVGSALDHASANATRNGAIVDLYGYACVMAIIKFATIAPGAAISVKMQSGALSTLKDAADLAGITIAVADDDDNQVFVIDLAAPAERYVRLVVVKDGANASAESAVYIRYGANIQPVVINATDLPTCELPSRRRKAPPNLLWAG